MSPVPNLVFAIIPIILRHLIRFSLSSLVFEYCLIYFLWCDFQAECYHYLFDAAIKLYQFGIDWTTPSHGPINVDRPLQYKDHLSTSVRAAVQNGNLAAESSNVSSLSSNARFYLEWYEYFGGWGGFYLFFVHLSFEQLVFFCLFSVEIFTYIPPQDYYKYIFLQNINSIYAIKKFLFYIYTLVLTKYPSLKSLFICSPLSPHELECPPN